MTQLPELNATSPITSCTIEELAGIIGPYLYPLDMWTCLDKRAEGVETYFAFLEHVVLDTTRSTIRARPVKQTISRTINKDGPTWLACLHRTCEHCVSSATPEPRSVFVLDLILMFNYWLDA